MSKLKKINLSSLIKTNTMLMALLGLLAGILYSFGGLIIDSLVTLNIFHTTETPGLSSGTALAFLALIGMPVIFAAFGFVVTILSGSIYNLLIQCYNKQC